MRRSDRQCTDEEARELLEQGEYGVLSIAMEDGAYGVPMNYAYVDGSLYLHCAGEGLKLDLLRRSPKASFCVVGATEVLPSKFSTKYESCIVQGTVSETTGEDKNQGLMALIRKYSSDFLEEGRAYVKRAANQTTVLKIVVSEISGKARH